MVGRRGEQAGGGDSDPVSGGPDPWGGTEDSPQQAGGAAGP